VSPYLFLLCVEVFTSLLKYFGGNYVDRGISVTSHWVNHLLFANDGHNRSAVKLNGILQIYWESSRQRVNRDKGAVFFNPNTSGTRKIMKHTLEIMLKGLVSGIWEYRRRLDGLLVVHSITLTNDWEVKCKVG
jgi:hypothetical protein